jgi:hypothetical protein
LAIQVNASTDRLYNWLSLTPRNPT